MIRIDLHLHSTFSDGRLTPEQLAARGKRFRISVMSLTDHDTTAGLSSFMAACRRQKIRAVPGIELSAEFPSTLHILGYRIDWSHPPLEEALRTVRDARDRRNEKICQNLRDLGFDITLKEVEREAGEGVIARPHMAAVLVRKGYVRDMPSAFAQYLGKNGKAYVNRKRLSPEECIALIRGAGGVAVMAHPVQTSEDYGEVRSIAGELKTMGLWGMECITSKHRSDQILRYLTIASDLGLFPTAGSDFHGIGSLPEMGVVVCDQFLPWARLGLTL